MTRVQRSKDCSNSPKNRLLQELTIAIARAIESDIREIVAADVQWTPIGRKSVTGVQAVCRGLGRSGPATALRIDHVVSHGRSGAVDGVMTFATKSRAFCHVFEFGSAKGTDVCAITTYAIPIKRPSGVHPE